VVGSFEILKDVFNSSLMSHEADLKCSECNKKVNSREAKEESKASLMQRKGSASGN
jgi:hypothetical protein